ncbi:MAG: glycosyltransferase family 2 protein [Bacteroidota bacterium]
MRISIITPSYNQGEFIESTIRSVMEQDHKDIEHLVIDGGSKDSTISTLKKYPHVQWVSEKDSGQSQAINKGFQRATGDIVAWINSDDYYEKNIFGAVTGFFESHSDCMLLYGDITFVDRQGRSLFSITGDTIDYERLVEYPDIVRQPSFFWRRELLEEIGGVDENLDLVMDYDFFLRAGKRHKFHYLRNNLSYYRYYEENKSRSLARRQIVEIIRVYRKNQLRITARMVKHLVGKFVRSFNLKSIEKFEQLLKGHRPSA